LNAKTGAYEGVSSLPDPPGGRTNRTSSPKPPTDTDTEIQTNAQQCKPTRGNASYYANQCNKYKPKQTNVSQFKPMQTNANQSDAMQPMQTNENQ